MANQARVTTYASYPPLSKGRFLRHPIWLVRIVRNRINNYTRWRRQGRPIDVPVVVKAGDLVVRSDGMRVMANWCWDLTHYEGPMYLETEDDVDRLWEGMLRFAEPRWSDDD